MYYKDPETQLSLFVLPSKYTRNNIRLTICHPDKPSLELDIPPDVVSHLIGDLSKYLFKCLCESMDIESNLAEKL